MVVPVYMSDNKIINCMDVVLITDKNEPDFAYIKDFHRFIFNQTKNKHKKHFSRYCFQCFSGENVLQKHKEICFKISGKQSVKL